MHALSLLAVCLLSTTAATAAEKPAPPDEVQALITALTAPAPVEKKEVVPAPVKPSHRDNAKSITALDSASNIAVSAIVLAAAIFGVYWFLRKKTGGPNQPVHRKRLRVSESVWLGRGQKLMLVEVGNRSILLGATSAGIKPLVVLPQIEEAFGDDEPAIPEARDFSLMMEDELIDQPPPAGDRLKNILQRLNTL